jgi:O-methyltransferase
MLTEVYRKLGRKIANELQWRRMLSIHRRYTEFTMIPPDVFAYNLLICQAKAPAAGCIVECGVWRGGMSAGMADALPFRRHYLFDSFEGLPPAKEVDGVSAIAWQKDVNSPSFFDNCRAERSFAERAMSLSGAREFELVQGWFSDTVPQFKPVEPIAVLRLDGDWYDSTMQCLSGLYHSVLPGGLILIDDYYAWDGCARAVHDFLSTNKLTDRLEQRSGLCFWTKRE